LRENQPEAGRDLMNNLVVKQLVAYHDTWEKFVEYQGEQMDLAAQAAATVYARSRRELILLLTLAAALAGGIGWFIVYNLRREISSRQQAEQALRDAQGELESRVTLRTLELTVANKESRFREERFRQLSASAPIGIFETDTAGDFLYTNPNWQEITGLTLEASLRQGWQQALHPDDAAQALASWRNSVEHGLPFKQEFRFRRPSGEERWALARSVVMCTGTGNITGHVGTMEDITERKRAGELLRLQEAALRSAANVVVITDHTGTVVWTNPAFTKVTGYTAEEMRGKNPRLLKHHETPESPDYYRTLWKTISSGAVWQGEFHNCRKDGTPLVEEATITPVRNERGDITHYVAVKQDVTERKLTQKRFAENEHRLRTILDAQPECVKLVAADGALLDMNHAGLRMIEADSLEQVFGKS
jgi:PAS domain S-box-containing protein